MLAGAADHAHGADGLALPQVDHGDEQKILEHWTRYADPVNVLVDASQTRPVEFLRPETIANAMTVLVLPWLHQREGFDARLASYRDRLRGANAAVVAPLERVVAWLRNHPEQRATG